MLYNRMSNFLIEMINNYLTLFRAILSPFAFSKTTKLDGFCRVSLLSAAPEAKIVDVGKSLQS